MADNLLGDLFSPDTSAYIDGDTIKDTESGNRLRFGGLDTREVSKFGENGEVIPGQVGGMLTRSLVSNLAKEQGFDTAVGDPNNTDPYGRILGDLVNPTTGETLSSYLLYVSIHFQDDP